VGARTYVVGLPVVVEVDDNGRVTFEVDLSEAGTSLADDEDAAAGHPDEVLADDARQVERAASSLSTHMTTTVEVP
jgi:hypothetical protein